MAMITRNCLFCNILFSRKYSLEKFKNMRFCSHSCWTTFRNLNKPKIIKNPHNIFIENIIFPENKNECWIYKIKGHWNYGSVNFNCKNILAHRFSYEKYIGLIPEGMFVCHKCDNPSCVNPEHLFLGNADINNKDRVKKGRSNSARGSKCGSSKLKEEDVLEIRRMCEIKIPHKIIGEKYKIHPEHVGLIKRRKRWAHLN